MAFSPAPKNPGDLIRSQDWNEAMGEVVRLESAKLSITGGNVNGPLSVSTLNIGTSAPPNRALTVRGTAGTYLNVIANNGTHEILLGADNAGGIVSTVTNHDLQLRAGGNVTRLTVKADGNVGIGTTSPVSTLQVKSLTAINEGVTGAGAWANFGSNAFFDGAWKRIDVNKAGVNLHMNAEGGGQEFRFLRVEANGQGLRNIAVIGAGVSYINEGNVGIGTTAPSGKLDVQGDIRAGNSDIYFTKTDHNHTGIGNALGYAAIENAANFGALMILGRTTTPNLLNRTVRLWDILEVHGILRVNGATVTGSSREQKQDIRALSEEEYQDILRKIERTPLYHYRFKSPGLDHRQGLGVIAEEAPEEIVDETGKCVTLLDYLGFLFAGLKAQAKEIKRLSVMITKNDMGMAHGNT